MEPEVVVGLIGAVGMLASGFVSHRLTVTRESAKRLGSKAEGSYLQALDVLGYIQHNIEVLQDGGAEIYRLDFGNDSNVSMFNSLFLYGELSIFRKFQRVLQRYGRFVSEDNCHYPSGWREKFALARILGEVHQLKFNIRRELRRG